MTPLVWLKAPGRSILRRATHFATQNLMRLDKISLHIITVYISKPLTDIFHLRYPRLILGPPWPRHLFLHTTRQDLRDASHDKEGYALLSGTSVSWDHEVKPSIHRHKVSGNITSMMIVNPSGRRLLVKVSVCSAINIYNDTENGSVETFSFFLFSPPKALSNRWINPLRVPASLPLVRSQSIPWLRLVWGGVCTLSSVKRFPSAWASTPIWSWWGPQPCGSSCDAPASWEPAVSVECRAKFTGHLHLEGGEFH